MPRRSILSATERDSLFTLPNSQEERIRHYTFNETDLSIIRKKPRVIVRVVYNHNLAS